ncbi:DUF721 domain-containing protein [bacterium]|nr:MAG: DUF721 domain-containing protein [bacterium]
MLRVIKSSFDDFSARHNIKGRISSSMVCETAQKVLETVFGSNCDFHTVSFKDGVLNVSVKSSVLSQELKFREKQIIGLVEDKVEGVRVKRIMINVK